MEQKNIPHVVTQSQVEQKLSDTSKKYSKLIARMADLVWYQIKHNNGIVELEFGLRSDAGLGIAGGQILSTFSTYHDKNLVTHDTTLEHVVENCIQYVMLNTTRADGSCLEYIHISGGNGKYTRFKLYSEHAPNGERFAKMTRAELV